MTYDLTTCAVQRDDADDADDDEYSVMGCGTSKTAASVARVHINGKFCKFGFTVRYSLTYALYIDDRCRNGA